MKTTLLFFGFNLIFTSFSISQDSSSLSSHCNSFLNTLSSSEVVEVKFDFKDSSRLQWTNLPVGMVPRKGIKYGSLSDESKIAFHHVLTHVLSTKGYLKLTSIMKLDDILNELMASYLEQGSMDSTRYNRLMQLQWAYDEFYIAIYGEPEEGGVWGLNFGGHHLSLNLTITAASVSFTPLFLGADPAEVKSGKYSGLRVLAGETDYGFLLLNALSEEQQEAALLSRDIPGDIITNPNSSQRLEEFWGIPAVEFNEEQKDLLKILIEEYVHNFEHKFAHGLMDKIGQSGLDNVYFAWIGSVQNNGPHYYMIHGPDFLIEYDNYPDNGNHIHLILRENGNDFGEDILRLHYETSEHHKKN